MGREAVAARIAPWLPWPMQPAPSTTIAKPTERSRWSGSKARRATSVRSLGASRLRLSPAPGLDPKVPAHRVGRNASLVAMLAARTLHDLEELWMHAGREALPVRPLGHSLNRCDGLAVEGYYHTLLPRAPRVHRERGGRLLQLHSLHDSSISSPPMVTRFLSLTPPPAPPPRAALRPPHSRP